MLAQFKSPLILILFFAAGLSFFLHDPVDASIILAIVLASGLLGFWQERGAAHALEKLLAIVQTKAVALRDGVAREIPIEEIVPGDVVVLSPGGNLPGDCLILESQDLFVDEATLTGETYPVAKAAAALPPETPLSQRTNTPSWEPMVSSHARPWSSARRLTEVGKVSSGSVWPRNRRTRRTAVSTALMEVTLVLVTHLRHQRLLPAPRAGRLPLLHGARRRADPQLLPATGSIAWPAAPNAWHRQG